MSTDERGLEHNLDASTFQKPLGELAEVLAQKVKREAPALFPAPKFVAVDLHVLIRQALRTYDLLFYLNADERRETDCLCAHLKRESWGCADSKTYGLTAHESRN